MRREPVALEREAVAPQLVEHVVEVVPDEVRQHEAIVQLGAPARQRRRVRLAPEARDQRPQQQLLRQAHARVRRHLERAHLEQAAPPRRAVGRIQLVDAELGAMRVAGDVDQQVPEQRDRPATAPAAARVAAAARTRSPARRRCRAALRRRAAPGSSGRGTGPRTGTTATDGCASRRRGCAADRAGAGTGCRAGVAPPSTK